MVTAPVSIPCLQELQEDAVAASPEGRCVVGLGAAWVHGHPLLPPSLHLSHLRPNPSLCAAATLAEFGDVLRRPQGPLREAPGTPGGPRNPAPSQALLPPRWDCSSLNGHLERGWLQRSMSE